MVIYQVSAVPENRKPNCGNLPNGFNEIHARPTRYSGKVCQLSLTGVHMTSLAHAVPVHCEVIKLLQQFKMRSPDKKPLSNKFESDMQRIENIMQVCQPTQWHLQQVEISEHPSLFSGQQEQLLLYVLEGEQQSTGESASHLEFVHDNTLS